MFGGSRKTSGEIGVGTGVYCVHEGGGEHVVESCGAGTGSLGGGRRRYGGRGAVVYCGGRRHSVLNSIRDQLTVR